MSHGEPHSSHDRHLGEEPAVPDPSPLELDALDRLIAGGSPYRSLAGALAAGNETKSLARVALTLRDAAIDDRGLNPDRTWARISAGLQAPAAAPSLWARLRAALAPPAGRRLSWAGSSIGALLIVTIAALLSVLALPGGSAQASFLETVEELATATDAALADNTIAPDEADDLQRHVQAVVAALETDPAALEQIAPGQTRAALRAIRRVRLALHDSAPTGADPVATATAAVITASVAKLDTVAATVAAAIDAAPGSTVDGANGQGDPAGDSAGDPGPARPAVDESSEDGGDTDPDARGLDEPADQQPTRPAVDDVHDDGAQTDLLGDTRPSEDDSGGDPDVILRPDTGTDLAPGDSTTTPTRPAQPPVTDAADGADGADGDRNLDPTAPDADAVQPDARPQPEDTQPEDTQPEEVGTEDPESDPAESDDPAAAGDSIRPRPRPQTPPPPEQPPDPLPDALEPDGERETDDTAVGNEAEPPTTEREPDDGSLAASPGTGDPPPPGQGNPAGAGPAPAPPSDGGDDSSAGAIR